MSKSSGNKPIFLACFLIFSTTLISQKLFAAEPDSLKRLQRLNEELFENIVTIHRYSPQAMVRLRSIFSNSELQMIGQGNPAKTKHALSKERCRQNVRKRAVQYANPRFEKICGAKYMAPIYDPKIQKPGDASACIDKFEFPNIPCEYPVVWVRAKEAHEICRALGKRICDAHEWEGACAGALRKPDYRFITTKGLASGVKFKQMRLAHNRRHAKDKRWSYGKTRQKGICAMNSVKDSACTGGSWKHCGSNTYPAGSFPRCKSDLDVYDIHGNAAEHMNLPLDEAQMASRGSESLGHTEMKGSWFIFDKFLAHQDWCRWRAPYWHGSRVMSNHSHRNYHLGFRCCKTISQKP